MKKYKKTQVATVEAIQYLGQEHELIQYIRLDYANNVMIVPMDFKVPPQDAFKAVKTHGGWKKIMLKDWIINKKSKVLLISDDVFQLLYDEI